MSKVADGEYEGDYADDRVMEEQEMKKRVFCLILALSMIVIGCGYSEVNAIEMNYNDEQTTKAVEINRTGDLTPFEWYASSSASAHKGTPSAYGNGSGAMEVPEWNTDDDNASGTIAIMDSGIDVTHPDLKDSLYTFTEEQQAKYGCGPHGINMEPAPKGVDPKEYAKDITDHNMHGTHVAGIIAAGVNGFGVSGIAKGVKIFAVRVFADDGVDQKPTDIVRGLEWLAKVAKDVNLKAVNISIGSGHSQLSHTIAVNKLGAMGVNVVYASGNETHDLDETVDMGAQNVSPYAINVDAEDIKGNVAPFSNYGKMTTDVCAPGSQILSTVPSMVEKKDGDTTEYNDQNHVFLHNTDPSHIANGKIETFSTDTPEVRMYDRCPIKKDGTENKKAKEIGKRVNAPGLGFTDDTSWEVRVNSLNDENDEFMSLAGGNTFRQNFWMAVPVEDEKDISWLSYTASVNDESNIYSGVACLLCTKKGSGGKETPTEVDMSIDDLLGSEAAKNNDVPKGISGTSAANLNSFMWSPCCLNIDSFTKQVKYVHKNKTSFTEIEDPGNIKGIYIWNKDGKKYILCRYAVAAADGQDRYNDKTCLYLDDIAVTDSQAATGAYAYLSGSSMAAPMVSATLAIIAKDEPENSSLSNEELKMLAIERAGKLMASVEYDNALLEKCSTGGRIKLHNKCDYTKKAPIFVSASETEGVLTLNGYFFGESGNLKVDGKEAMVTQWTDQVITADVSTAQSGSHVAIVTNSDGKRRQIIFSVKGDIIYENELSLPINEPGFYEDYTDLMSSSMVISGQFIYTLGTDGNKYMKALWKYDIKNDKWSRCANLPKAIKNYMAENGGMVALDGKIYLYACRKHGDCGDSSVYSYDTKKNKWKKAFSKKLPKLGQLFKIKKQVFFINSDYVKKLDIKKGKLTKVKIKMPDIEEIDCSRIAVSGNKVYLFGYKEDKKYNAIPCMYRLTWNKKNSFKVESLSKVAKKLGVCENNIVLTGYEDGVVIVGPRKKTDNRYNTYFVENNKKTLNVFERSACFHDVYMPMSVYSKGMLYVMGISCTEPDTIFFRSTGFLKGRKKDF